jgi:hypothetical protein
VDSFFSFNYCLNILPAGFFGGWTGRKMINVGLLLGYADGVHFSALLLRFHFWDCCIMVGTFAPLPPHASGNKLVFIV